jgi:integrase
MPVQRVWRPSLRILGIRDRDARETRHTYATMALMAGVNPAYIAKQLGHANAKMVYEVYAKWIDGADKSREKNRMNAWLNVTPVSQETLKSA